jgi:hypothetical protein
MNNIWNERYSQEEYVYGEEPNVFIAEQLNKLQNGIIILPCEGEGRNAVHAASQGWIVKWEYQLSMKLPMQYLQIIGKAVLMQLHLFMLIFHLPYESKYIKRQLAG